MKKLCGEVESRFQNLESERREARIENREKYLKIKPYPPALMLRWRNKGKTIKQEPLVEDGTSGILGKETKLKSFLSRI